MVQTPGAARTTLGAPEAAHSEVRLSKTLGMGPERGIPSTAWVGHGGQRAVTARKGLFGLGSDDLVRPKSTVPPIGGGHPLNHSGDAADSLSALPAYGWSIGLPDQTVQRAASRTCDETRIDGCGACESLLLFWG